MRRLIALIAVVVLVPATAASADELEDLLERSRGASYSAEQVISCNTPDGARDAVVRIAQDGGGIWLGSSAGGDVEVNAGSGGWTLLRGGDTVTSASVDAGEGHASPVYAIEETDTASFLGRPAMTYQLVRDGTVRALLVFDDESGALVEATTFLSDGTIYCQRRFISFDPTPPSLASVESDREETLLDAEPLDSSLPDLIEGFERLDLYVDADGTTFGYYSDGFFSFAVFETPTRVTLSDSVRVEVGGSVYDRSFTAGQATYVWEIRSGGMALVGDLPSDLHPAILQALPQSEEPGLFRRLWRSLFG